MNGAGAGGRLVARRQPTAQSIANARSQIGNREQRRADLRYAFRNMGGNGVGGASGSWG